MGSRRRRLRVAAAVTAAAVMVTLAPWALSPAGAEDAVSEGAGAATSLMSVEEAEAAWTGMDFDTWSSMMAKGGRKLTKTRTKLVEEMQGIPVNNMSPSQLGALSSNMRYSMRNYMAGWGWVDGRNSFGGTKTIPPKDQVKGRAHTRLSKAGRLLGKATLAFALFDLSYTATGWVMEHVVSVDSDGFVCDVSYLLTDEKCGVAWEPVEKPDDWNLRSAGNFEMTWSSERARELMTGVGAYIWDEDTYVFFDGGAMKVKGIGYSVYGPVSGPFYWEDLHFTETSVVGGTINGYRAPLFYLNSKLLSGAFKPGGTGRARGKVVYANTGSSYRGTLEWEYAGEDLANFPGTGMVYQATCRNRAGWQRIQTEESGDVDDFQEIGKPGRASCPLGEVMTAMRAMVPWPDASGETVWETVWGWDATAEEIEQMWEDMERTHVRLLSLFKVEGGYKYDCFAFTKKCADWYEDLRAGRTMEREYECRYGQVAVALSECFVYRREFNWPRSVEEDLTDPRTLEPIPVRAGNPVVSPERSPSVQPMPEPERPPILVWDEVGELDPGMADAPWEVEGPVVELQPVPVEPPVEEPGDDPGDEPGEDPSKPPVVEPGDGDLECPPKTEWSSLFNVRWYFEGVLCALKAAFVPESGFMQEQVDQTVSVASEHAPTSLVVAAAAALDGLGKGWSGGCSAMPDFSGVSGLHLAVGCSPPDSAAWRVGWAIMVVCLWVGAAFAVWRMGHQAIGGKE